MKTEKMKSKSGQNWWIVFCIALVVGAISFCCGSYYFSAFAANAKGAQVYAAGTVPPALTSNDVLLANNQVIGQVGTMYQHFGLFITSIVALSGALITYMGSMAKKNVDEFMSEWKGKLETLETSLGTSKRKLEEAVKSAEQSAKNAADHEQIAHEIVRTRNPNLVEDDETDADVAQVTETLQGLLPPINKEEGGE